MLAGLVGQKEEKDWAVKPRAILQQQALFFLFLEILLISILPKPPLQQI